MINEKLMQLAHDNTMENLEASINSTTYLKAEAIKLLDDPKLHPKEKVILDKLMAGDTSSLGILDVAYKLSIDYVSVGASTRTFDFPQVVKCNMVIFPWSWVGKSHKVRKDIRPDNLAMKRLMFRTYKENLHKRRYWHLVKGNRK